MDRYLVISSDGHAGLLGSLKGLTDAELAAVLGFNAAALYDRDLPALNAIAARIGPRKAQFAQAA